MSGISDQFESEPVVSYTSSYTDTVVFGEIFSYGRTLDLGYSPLGTAVPFNSRRLLSSKIGRNVTHYLNNAWMPGWLVNGYASGSFLGRPQRFQRVFSDGEFFHDSFVPNPVEIHQTNGASLQGVAFTTVGEETINEYSGTFYGMKAVENVGLRSGRVNLTLTFLTYPSVASTVTARITSSWVDTKWGPSFPMQSRYKNVERLFAFNGELPKRYAISNFYDGGVMSPVSTSNQLSGIAVLVSGSAGGWAQVTCYGALKRPTEAWPFSAGTYKLGTAAVREMTNLYFGFGDGIFDAYTGGGYAAGQIFRGIPKISSLIGGNFVSDTDLPGTFVQPRGYRYGLKAVEPEHSSCVFRIGRFGQVRDMLEQRPFSKMRDISNGAIGTDGPVRFSFLTGSTIYSQSLDYVTATNPSYNPRDSGVWDVEYKSGQPFADMDPVD